MPICPVKLLTILTIPELQKKWEIPGRGIERELSLEQHKSRDRDNWNRLRQAKKNNLIAYQRTVGIPKIFESVKNEYLELRSLFLTGGFGTGKTYKAIQILKGFIKSLPCINFTKPFGNVPVFITMPELLMKIRSCFSLSECEETIVYKYSDCPLLVIDDLGAEKTTEFSLQTLYIILNRRYNEQLQTIITSNLSIDEIRDKFGDRIASRIAGMCKIIKLQGKDKRLNL